MTLRTRLRSWRRRRAHRIPCETCNTLLAPKRAHTVTELFEGFDDPEADIVQGGSSMSATYCAGDCPGGCDKEHSMPKKPKKADVEPPSVAGPKPRRPNESRPRRIETRRKKEHHR